MIFSYLKPENLYKKYLTAKEYTEGLTEDFQEFERVARNRPHADTPSEFPKTTDGTTASIIRKTPKRIIQQLPTGKIESDNDKDWLPIVAEFVYNNRILPYANEEYDLIQKDWSAIENGLTFGSQCAYTPFVSRDGQFTTDKVLPYWADVFIQPGKKSGYSCEYIFLRSWWQEEDIDAIIQREKKLKEAAKKRGEQYESEWDCTELEAIKESISTKAAEEQSPHERELETNPTGIEIVTAFQNGIEAEFFTFHPSSSDNDKGDTETEARIVRTKVNKDPRGKMPIDWFYADIDGENPLGRGIVDLLKGIQNLIDADMQMYQYNRALMLQPPLIVRGNVKLKNLAYQPNRIIKMKDPNASIDPLNIDTSAVVNYPDLYGLQKSQLLNLVSSPDTSISSDIGNPGFGKTPEALKTQNATLSVDDNYLRKMYEAFHEHWSETAINLYFAERSGIEELQLDEDTASKLRKLADQGYFDPAKLSEDNKIIIDYDEATPALKFRVDASTSKMKDDSAQGEILTNLLKGIEGSRILSQIVPTEKILALYNRLVSVSSVNDPEELLVDIQEFIEQQEAAQQEQAMLEEEAAAQGGIDPSQIPEGEVMPSDEMPMQAEPELPVELAPTVMDGVSPDNPIAQIYQSFVEQGIPEDLAMDAADMAAQGAQPDEVLAALEEVMING